MSKVQEGQRHDFTHSSSWESAKFFLEAEVGTHSFQVGRGILPPVFLVRWAGAIGLGWKASRAIHFSVSLLQPRQSLCSHPFAHFCAGLRVQSPGSGAGRVTVWFCCHEPSAVHGLALAETSREPRVTGRTTCGRWCERKVGCRGWGAPRGDERWVGSVSRGDRCQERRLPAGVRPRHGGRVTVGGSRSQQLGAEAGA